MTTRPPDDDGAAVGQPWWRSAADAIADDEDPLATHLGARQRDGGDGDDGREGHQGSDCEVCPICRGIAHVRANHPGVAEHLVEAARHLTMAMREISDGLVSPDDEAGHDTGFESIPLDEDPDVASKTREVT